MTPTERKEQARLSARGIIDIVIAECSVNRHATPEERSIFERAVVAVDAYAAACVSEALAKTVKLGDCCGIVEAVNEACTCGGGEPGHCCPACEVYHAIKGMEIVKP